MERAAQSGFDFAPSSSSREACLVNREPLLSAGDFRKAGLTPLRAPDDGNFGLILILLVVGLYALGNFVNTFGSDLAHFGSWVSGLLRRLLRWIIRHFAPLLGRDAA